jgi:hypothetical protein
VGDGLPDTRVYADGPAAPRRATGSSLGEVTPGRFLFRSTGRVSSALDDVSVPSKPWELVADEEDGRASSGEVRGAPYHFGANLLILRGCGPDSLATSPRRNLARDRGRTPHIMGGIPTSSIGHNRRQELESPTNQIKALAFERCPVLSLAGIGKLS